MHLRSVLVSEKLHKYVPLLSMVRYIILESRLDGSLKPLGLSVLPWILCHCGKDHYYELAVNGSEERVYKLETVVRK